jgi:beta-glucosidase
LNRTIQAFNAEKIHAGNRGLQVDHDQVSAAVGKLLERMSLAQKIHEIHGWQPAPIDGLYFAGGDDELGIPSFRMVDGPRGARAGTATAFPVAIARGASFDPALERRVGLAIGLEVAARGGNVLLAPTINLLRHPGWGRAQETYSEDSFHMGAMAVAFISGAQNHVLTSPKHFAANNLENTRFDMSSNIDERVLHEVYLAHFRRCVCEAAAASIMSSYNKINGVYCSEDPYLLTEVLRQRWGFKGFVESDWYLGTRSTAQSLRAGMDIEMPGPYRRANDKLMEALAAGEITENDIETAAGRALYQKIAWDLNNLPVPDEAVVECDEHVALSREVAEKSLVLLKNEQQILPLADRAGVRIAVVGDMADQANLGDRGSSMVTSSSTTSPLAGIQALVKQAAVDYFPTDADLSSLGDYDCAIVVTGLTYKEEGEFIPTAQVEAEQNDLARGGDRTDLKLPQREEELISRVAAAAAHTVVVLEGGSAIVVERWLDGVDALLMAWYPGREGGAAIARALFGAVNPSGRLPVSFPRSIRQLMDWDVTSLNVAHDLFHGYRYHDHHQQEPRFEFGFGLSYSRFEISGLRVQRAPDGFLLLCDVSNASEVAGACVVQVYAATQGSAVERVVRELKQFARVELAAGETATVELPVSDESLCYFNIRKKDFELEPCGYQFQVGFSSRDLPLQSDWTFSGEDWQPSTFD